VNGPGSFSPGCTLFSARGMAQIGEWSRFINQGQDFPRVDSFSPGCTLFSVRGMAQDREWCRLKNHDNYSSLFEKNSPANPSLMFYSEGRCSSRSHRCEWKNGPDDSFYIITLFLCRLISINMITMETVCLQTTELCYCGGYVPLFVTMCHRLSSCVLLWINKVVFYQLTMYQLSWRLSS
jgi:hypothetical protein